MKRDSLAGPLVLIGIGAFFLARKWIPDFHPIELFVEWWPALLIIFGAVQLAQRLSSSRTRT